MHRPGCHAQFVQDAAGMVVGEAGRIVVPAQVAQEEILQPRMHEAADGVPAGVVGEVAGTLADAHLELVRIGSAEQHIHIEIGLHDHRLGFFRPVHGLLRDMAEIRHQHEQPPFAAEDIAHCLGRIVRNLEIPGLDPLRDRIPAPVPQVPPAGADLVTGEGMAGKRLVQERGRVDRTREALAHGAEVPDMVPVVMGDEDGLETVESQVLTFQDFLYPADADAGISIGDQQRDLPLAAVEHRGELFDERVRTLAAFGRKADEIVPVTMIDRDPVADGVPGEITKKLLAAYKEYVKAELAKPSE